MIDIGGQIFYIDMDALDNLIALSNDKSNDKIVVSETKTSHDSNGLLLGTETIKTTTERGKEIDGAKYDMIKMLLEILIDYDEETDNSLGIDRALAKTPLAYKIAFNTLYNYGVLKEQE